jgi:hypothetical protein
MKYYIMLSNFDIEKLCKFYRLPLIAICMKNELPTVVKDGCYIINMQSSHQGNGTHWVGLYVYKLDAFYFDSFGAIPPNEIMAFVKRRKGCHLYYNNWIIQDLSSQACGWFCIAFLIYMHQNRNRDLKQMFNEFTNNFHDDTTKNDEILKSFFASSGVFNRPVLVKNFIK